MEQKSKIIKILNEEINIFASYMDRYIRNGDFLRAAIVAKLLNRLNRMVARIQDEV